jgi:glutamate racemase
VTVEERVMRAPKDALVYGCTHYPLLDGHFRAVLGNEIALVDPAIIQAERAEMLLGTRAHGAGLTEYVTSGDERSFHASVARMSAVSAVTL